MKKHILSISLFLYSGLFGQVNGTSGLPIGGIGTGAIKYNAYDGTFSANFRTPTRNGDYQLLANTHFQMFSKRGYIINIKDTLKAVRKDNSIDDDAIFPLHKVNFGELDSISVIMSAYIPFDPQSISMMCHPAAMYEFTLSNLTSDSIVTAVAFRISTPAVPEAIADSGFVANHSSLQICLLGKIDESSGDISYGNDDGFFSTGICDNVLSGTTNRLAIRVSLGALEVKRLRFVLSWYKIDDIQHYRYAALWNSAKSVAVSASSNFNLFKNNNITIVTRMRASNLPAWLVDQTLNSLVNLVNNSVFFQDGRYCHTEGMWDPEGTMDQMWHARQIFTMINPELAWQELEWWARTQHVLNYTGQIHHDFGTNYNYVDWDNTEHSDYRDISAWVDLNCGLIISVYEAFIATADTSKLSFFWPYVKKAGQRILDQVQQYGDSQYPFTFSTSLSSYDAGGNSQAYNTGISVVSYHIMDSLASIMEEPATAALYENAFQQAVTGFENKYLDNQYNVSNYCESALAGPWIANFLKMGPFWEKQKLDNLYSTISYYYNPLSKGMGYPGGSYSEWQTYLIGHLGGYALQTNRKNIWSSLQLDMYERNYLDRNLVFNQQLGIPAKVLSPVLIATSTLGTNQYISIPVLWRNYYDIVGFHQNKFSGELWLEPRLIDPTIHQLQNALILMPGGYASIQYNTYGDSYQNQQITFTPDELLNVSAIYVWDLYADSLNSISKVTVDGTTTGYLRTGNGDQTHLKLNWSGTIPITGMTIEIEGVAKPSNGVPETPTDFEGSVLGPSQILLKWKADTANILGCYIESKIGSDFQQIGSVARADSSYLDTGLLSSTEYTYRIRSYNSQNISDPSQEIKVRTDSSGNGDVTVALNSGGDNYQSAGGTQYIGDASSGFVSGGNTYSTSSAIANTEDDVLYQTERYGNFSYSIPLSNDLYNVVLKFAEIYQDNPGTRIFNVNIEGNQVIRNLDLFFRTGKNIAYDVVVPVELQDGNLNIDFVTIIDNAKLSALEVRRRDTSSGGNPNDSDIPTSYSLSQNYPNPFNSSTIIKYELPASDHVTLKVFDILGKEVATLVNQMKAAGSYYIPFDAKSFSSGMYFYQMRSSNFMEIKKMVLIK
jgi:uncharacterized protein (DUF608 family)